MLSLARHSMAGGILLGGHEEELLEVELDDELTRCVVSEDWGLKIIGTLEVVPLTGELPEVKPSSAELEWHRPSTGGKSGLWIRVHLQRKGKRNSYFNQRKIDIAKKGCLSQI